MVNGIKVQKKKKKKKNGEKNQYLFLSEGTAQLT